MYVSRAEITLDGTAERDLISKVEAAHASRRSAAGFRWAMLLRPIDGAGRYASVSMWLTPEHDAAWRAANDTPAPMHGYDVTTARGAMTPAAAAAIVEWRVDPADAVRFAARWNAAYHAIEDVFGSRLLQDLETPSGYAGLHVVTDASRLDPKVLGAAVTDGEGLAMEPLVVERYQVVLLTEAP
jgi:heme-degrading monooxygenase HmoA